MVQVVDVDIGALGVSFPSDSVGMVIAQPFLELTDHEPFTCRAGATERLLQSVDATLDVSLRRFHGAEKTHFTVFPECAIPGLLGVEKITTRMEQADWPCGTVVIGGVDGLTKGQYSSLVGNPHSSHDSANNAVGRVRDDQWVNCSVTWVKSVNEQVKFWVQPKIEPAWVELVVNNQSMFRGQSIYLFQGRLVGGNFPFSFSTLLCYDWIGSVGDKRIWECLLNSINQTAATAGMLRPLTWLFIAQYNPAPSHASFMGQVAPFFNQANFQHVLRDNTSLIMANVAGCAAPGKAAKYGKTSVITTATRYSKPESQPTFCSGGEPYRAGNPLENLRETLFREQGACIHSFVHKNAQFLPPGAAGRALAVPEATVHPLLFPLQPRAPAGLVPAVIKWLNDNLDETSTSLAAKYPDRPLVVSAAPAHAKVVEALRLLSPDAAGKTILAASPTTGSPVRPDSWTNKQSSALGHVLQAFTILEVAGFHGEFHGTGAQATVKKGERALEVIAVQGTTHEECDKHVMNLAVAHHGQLLVISRDEDNTKWPPAFRSILDTKEVQPEYNFTDPGSAVIRVAYRDVLDAYLAAEVTQVLEDSIDATIG